MGEKERKRETYRQTDIQILTGRRTVRQSQKEGEGERERERERERGAGG